ncbi:MAG: signal peptidase I [candidate division Zixibacteria bacterium]|nr:signal peptidase I [candidate division Zixibacteria bacterium]
MNTQRKPIVATLLALLSPGLGYLYCGEWRKALYWLLGFLLVSNLCYAAMVYVDIHPTNVLLFLGGVLGFWLCQLAMTWQMAGRQSKDYVLRRYNRWYWYVLYCAVVLVLIELTYPAIWNHRGFRIVSGSMSDVLQAGEMVLTDLDAYKSSPPERGDVVVVKSPQNTDVLYVERCVALPGDTVEMIKKELLVNGASFAEPETVNYSDSTIKPKRDDFGPYVVPDQHYFMLGDNRDNAWDSRYWGPVHEDLLVARAIRIYYSSDWSRIGLRVE